MNSKKETALKLVKAFKNAVFPIYITGYLIFLLVAWLALETDGAWLLLAGIFIVLIVSPFFVGLFGALLWTQYILEGYVKGTDKKIRCVISFSLSALGILFFIGWLLVAFDVWDIFAKPFYDSWLFWLIEGEGMYLIDTLVVLLYPILMIVESLLKKESQACDQGSEL